MAPSEPTAPAVASSDATSGGSPPAPGLARSAGVVGAATLTSRVLGLVRDQVLAYLFGAGNAMDAFNVAYRIPNLMRDLFAEGAMSAAFVPTFTRRLTLDGKAAAWRVGNQLVNFLLFVTGTLVLLGIVFAEPLTRLLAGSYTDVPGKLELTVVLTRIMLPFLTLVAVAAAVMGMLNSLNRFFAPALSPAMFNVGIIASAVLLVPLMPRFGLHPITAIAIGAIVGGIGQIALQLPSLYREGLPVSTSPRPRRLRPPGDPSADRSGHHRRCSGPDQSARQHGTRHGEGTGAVSWLSYAFRIMYLPIGIFGVSIATATLPAVSRHAAQDALGDMRDTISNALRMMLVLNVPALVGLIVLAGPIVGLIFERGSFLPSDTASTTAALVFYTPGLVGYSAVRIAVPCFYAMRNSITPTLVSLMAVALNIVLNLILVRTMGFRGLALGTSIAALVNALVLLVLLHGRLGGLDVGRILATGAKITLAAILMGGVVWSSHRWLLGVLPGQDLTHRLMQVFGSIASGLVMLTVAARLLRIAEWDDLRQQLLSRRRT